MVTRDIRITQRDMERLRELIDEAKRGDPRKAAELCDLEAELDRAILTAEEELPDDVIRMNSEALLVDVETGEEMWCRLVFPGDADIAHMRVSVLAPVGKGMLGYRAGDEFEWPVPAGTRRFLIRQVCS